MKIVLNSLPTEIIVKGSRFIAEVTVLCCDTNAEKQQEARNFLKQVKKKYQDATHVVHAFVIGKNAEVTGSSDDGEPSGTAGRPVLEVLKGANVTNVLLTVTRYFGGTLLGTGGLVKAYTESAKAVLQNTEFEELVEYSFFTVNVSYELLGTVKRILETEKAIILTEDYAESITINGKIPQNLKNTLFSTIFDSTQGKVIVEYNS